MDAYYLTDVRVAHIVGARPQFVKLKPLAAAVVASAGVNWIAHTGQHYDASMNASFWEELGFRPDYQGTWGNGDADLDSLVAALRAAAVDAVVVYGDTDSTVLGARAALALNLPLAHAEAGLRSFNDRMPEERNRVWVDQQSQWLWAPTEGALRQLHREGRDAGWPWVANVGDLMLDAFPKRPWGPGDDSKILVTIHRNTNVDDEGRLRRLERAVDALASRYTVIWPRHPRHRAAGLGSKCVSDCLPFGRSELLDVLHHVRWVLTDSGGLQKEAFFAGRRAVVLRSETEWTELVAAGWTRLVHPDTPELHTAIEATFAAWRAAGIEAPPDLYGGGRAAVHMVRSLRDGLMQLRG